MRFTQTAKTAIGGLLFLASCHAFATASDLKVKSINIPAYTLISDTLTNIAKATSSPNKFVMQQICDLARGDKTQQEVNQALEKNNINVSSIPAQGAITSLLINNDRPAQAYVCSAYIATTLLNPSDNDWLYEHEKDKNGATIARLDQVKFVNDARLKMAMAQATAQFYAIIASNLPTTDNSSWNDYQRSVINTAYNYAPDYLQLLKKLYSRDTARYSPGTITKSSISIADNQGRELQISPKGTVLISRGIVWMGNGKILGKEYFIPVNIIPSSAHEGVKESPKRSSLKSKSSTNK